MSIELTDLLLFSAIPVAAIVSRMVSNRYAGVTLGTLAGCALLGPAMTLASGDAFSEIDLEVPD